MAGLGNSLLGNWGAALAGFSGVAVFGGWAYVVRRTWRVEPVSPRELDELEHALARGIVRVHDFAVRDALILCQRRLDEVDDIGFVLDVGSERFVFVARQTCAGIDPELLPNRALRLEVIPGGPTLRAEASGEPIPGTRWIVDELPWFVGSELVLFAGSLAQLRAAEPPAT
jgi:hypothetical protein